LCSNSTLFLTRTTGCRLGGGRPQKWLTLQKFIVEKLKHPWEIGAPLTKEKLQFLVQQHMASSDNDSAINIFVKGKHNTLQKFIARTLEKNKWSN